MFYQIARIVSFYKNYFFKNYVALSFAILLAVGCSNNYNNMDVGDQAPGKFPIEEFSDGRKTVMPDNWFTKSPDKESLEGVQSDRAISELKLKHTREIIVAVIDSGVDLEHKDLKRKRWVNPGEIPNNGFDDDNNGYPDDIHGWNFIGGYDENRKPIHIEFEQLEVTRELVKMRAKKKRLLSEGKDLNPIDQQYFDKLQAEVSVEIRKATDSLKTTNERLDILSLNYEILKSLMTIPFEQMNEESVNALVPTTEVQRRAKSEILKVFEMSATKTVARYKALKDRYSIAIHYYYNEEFQPRKDIVKDDPEDIKDIYYGNNDVKGPDASHGTHVAGIIAAERNKDFGIWGIAVNVKIMALRVVPNGDERDKDVALAIRYAADNGANIINMSFGKDYSPQRHLVTEALLYAQAKGLLIMHSAGNEASDIDHSSRFPEKKIFNSKGEEVGHIENFMDIGASSSSLTTDLAAWFTNFGHITVDIFAPGVAVRSTVPDNKYAIFSGTSMACPAAAGVAALVWSQLPNATAHEIKELMMRSSRSRRGATVRLPSNHTQNVPFETLSISGGIVDAYLMLKQ